MYFTHNSRQLIHTKSGGKQDNSYPLPSLGGNMQLGCPAGRQAAPPPSVACPPHTTSRPHFTPSSGILPEFPNSVHLKTSIVHPKMVCSSHFIIEIVPLISFRLPTYYADWTTVWFYSLAHYEASIVPTIQRSGNCQNILQPQLSPLFRLLWTGTIQTSGLQEWWDALFSQETDGGNHWAGVLF